MAHLTRAVCVLVVCLYGSHGATDNSSYRLPQTCKPSSYDVYIKPDFYDAKAMPTFNGSVVITITCSNSTDRVTLHQQNLVILDKNVTWRNTKLPFHVEEDQKRDFYTIILDDNREFKAKAAYKLSFTFSGVMRKDGYGLYYSAYLSDDGQAVGVAATQMEPTFARSLFPCFDEPGFKATFAARIARRTDTGRNYTTVFNTPLQQSTVDPKDKRWMVDSYGPTPVMASYLFAMVVSDFEAVTDNIDLGELHNGTEGGQLFPYRNLVKPGTKKEAKLAHQAGIDLFSWFDTHLAPPYEKFISKIDSVSVPVFAAGGMENWGLILYLSRLVSYVPKQTGMFIIDATMALTSHELIHQWFGNLVTPKWWDSIWLNEGFAAFWQYYGPLQVYPDWKMDELTLSTRDFSLMQADGSKSSHPLIHPVQTPAEARAMFDQYSYFKGGAVIRMVQMVLGEHFLPALKYYLKKHQLGSVDSDDLWKALDEYAGTQGLQPKLSKRMPPWVEQKGYPVLWATPNCDRDKVTFKQEIFPVQDLDTDYTPPYGNRFDIPMQVASNKDLRQNVTRSLPLQWFLGTGDNETTVQLDKRTTWYVVNQNHLGYYRVVYDDNNYKALYKQLLKNPMIFTPLTRATILDDAFRFHKAGGKFREAVKGWPFLLTHYLKAELSFPAWYVFHREMEYYSRLLLLSHFKLFKRYSNFVVRIARPVVDRLTFDIKSDLPPYDSIVRTWIAEVACKSKLPYCVRYGTKAVNRYKSSNSPMNINLREALYCGALGGNKKEARELFRFLKDELANVTNNWQKAKHLAALGCMTQKKLILGFLNSTLNKEVPGLESGVDMMMLLEQYAFSHHPSQVTLRFLVDNFDSILQRIGQTGLSQGLVTKVFQYLSNNTDNFNTVKPLLTKMQGMGDSWKKLADQAFITAENNANYIKDNRKIFKAWLRVKS